MINEALKKLHDKHVAKFGKESGWIKKAAWKIGVTAQQMYLWNSGTTFPNLENRVRLIMLSEMDDPYDPKVRLPPIDLIGKIIRIKSNHMSEEEIGSLDDLLSQMEEPESLPGHPVFIPGEYPVWIIDRRTTRFWCELDEDFCPEMLSDLPGIDCNLRQEIDAVGLAEILDWRRFEINSALEHGLTYRQPFQVEVDIRYYKSWTEWGYEWDCETEFEILEIKPLPTDEVIRRYEEWLGRK